jgi:uncharacterized protein YndB with AHSA1/START domain
MGNAERQAGATDRIEKSVLLRAEHSRVWRALTDSQQFGQWFGVSLRGPFVAGKSVSGAITYEGYTHLTMEVHVEAIEPETLFSYRWHPAAIDASVDYSSEPTTLVEFRLAEAPGGTLLTVVESGFDGIPLGRRAKAWGMNDEGWAQQMEAITRYLANAV